MSRDIPTYQTYREDHALTQDRIAWTLCQIIDDDAPLRWTRYRSVAQCIVTNEKLMEDFMILRKQLQPKAATPLGHPLPQDVQLEASVALRKFKEGHDGSETVRQRIEAMTEDQKILLIAELLLVTDHASKMGYII